MKPLLHPELVNGPFEDPGVLVDFLHTRRAFLFDMGDLSSVPPRKLLRVTHVFVSHTHMDHFYGFDRLVRLSLGRDKLLHLYGPAGFIRQVRNHLASYTWNLVQNYTTEFTIVASEYDRSGRLSSARFPCRTCFRAEHRQRRSPPAGLLLDEETLQVTTTVLDHSIPCLAFSLQEKNHVNIMKNRLLELGLPVGPWLGQLRRAVLRQEPDDTPFTVLWRDGQAERERVYPLGELRNSIVSIDRGQKITYVTDAVFSSENRLAIVDLARGSDYLFIETPFLHRDLRRATERFHLTALQAGVLAGEAGVGRVVPFHFSPKYHENQEEFIAELREGWRMTSSC